MLFKKTISHNRPLCFSNVESLVIETKGMHFELFPKCQKIKYRNVISPAEGGMRFPDGYFDEKTTTISNHDIEQISTAVDRMFQTKTPKTKLSLLPDGATRDAYMRITLTGNTTAYYSNTHVVKGGFVEHEKVDAEFTQIVQILEPLCVFQKFVSEEIPVVPDSDLISKTNINIESDKKIHLIGYRFDATGVFGYVFYKASEEICSVSSIVAPSAPVIILGSDVKMRSDFEECTIFPGLTRIINDESDGKQVFKIIYKDRGQYIINDTVAVYCCNGKYAFYSDRTVIATIKRIMKKSECPMVPMDRDYDYTPFFSIDYCSRIENELMMIILAFPMLQFGL